MKRNELIELAKVRFDWKYLYESSGFRGSKEKLKNGEYISIQSDNVSMAGYDASSQRMTVVFDNGKAYWYQPVDQN